MLHRPVGEFSGEMRTGPGLALRSSRENTEEIC